MNKSSLLILHGAIGSNAQMAALKNALSEDYDVYAPNFPGHGGDPSGEDFSIPVFADFVKNYILVHQLQQPLIFGYSMGGYVACYLALHYPQLIRRIITLGTKFHWDEATAAAETKMLQPDILEQKVPKFAATLAQLHAPQDWKVLLHQTAGLMRRLGADPALKPADYRNISTPCLLLVGDRDKMVSIEETMAVYRSLPAAQFSVLPGTGHAIEQVSTDLISGLINRFGDPATV